MSAPPPPPGPPSSPPPGDDDRPPGGGDQPGGAQPPGGGWGTPPPPPPGGGAQSPGGGWGTPPPPPPGGGASGGDWGGPPPPGGPGGPGGHGGPAGPQQYSVGNAVGYGWNKFKDNAGLLILLTLVVIVGIGLVQLLGNIISGAILGTAETTVDPTTGQFTTAGGASFTTAFIVSMVFAALSMAVQLAVQVGIIKGSLQLTRGQDVSVGSAFSGVNWGQVILTAVLVGLGTLVGLILCIVPGLIWIFLTSYSLYYVIDRGMGAVDAIKASITMVTKNLGPLILFWLASLAIIILGVCACGVGVLVAYPVVILAQAYTFRTFNNDPVTV